MIEAALAFLAGLLFGSFLNVCIHRLPRDESIVWPGSRCVTCGHPIRWFDNVPVLSYAILGARCRDCRSWIHWRYPLIELLTATLFALVMLTWGPTLAAVKWAVCVFLLLGMVFSDLETRILPDEFTIGGIVLGVIASALVPLEGGLFAAFWPQLPAWAASAAQSVFAALFVSGALYLAGIAFQKIRHKEGLGFGDVKMVAMMGAFLGLSQSLVAIFFGCVAGSLCGIAYIYLAKKDPAAYELPFGSFLGAGGIVVCFLGEGMLRWYTQL